MRNMEDEIKSFIVSKVNAKMAQVGIPVGDIDDDFSLTGSGVFDSMSFFELIIAVEQKFEIEIDFSGYELEDFTTLTGFARCAAKCKVK